MFTENVSFINIITYESKQKPLCMFDEMIYWFLN